MSTTQLAVIGQDGWRSPHDMPDNDRIVQIAWDDMSFGTSRGFVDSTAGDPERKRVWWRMNPVFPVDISCIGAWRDTSNDEGRSVVPLPANAETEQTSVRSEASCSGSESGKESERSPMVSDGNLPLLCTDDGSEWFRRYGQRAVEVQE